MGGADHELVEITFEVDRHKSDQRIGLFCNNDRRVRRQFVAPALAPPWHARGEVDGRIGLLPAALPQRDRGVLVLAPIGAQVKRRGHYLSFSSNSMRRWRLSTSSVAA